MTVQYPPPWAGVRRKKKLYRFPDVPHPRDSYTVRVCPVYFDGGFEAYTTLVKEKPRVKVSHETGKPEQRQAKLGWPGGRLEHKRDRTVFLAGCTEVLEEIGVSLNQNQLERFLSVAFRLPQPHLRGPGEEMPFHWDIFFLVFSKAPLEPYPSFHPDPDEIDEVLRRVRLSDLKDFTYDGLSIGINQQKRVARLFQRPQVQAYLEENGVHHSDIEVVANLVANKNKGYFPGGR